MKKKRPHPTQIPSEGGSVSINIHRHSQDAGFAEELQDLTGVFGTGQDVSPPSWRLFIKPMSVKTEPCFRRCVRLDQDSHGRICFSIRSPYFTLHSAGSPPLYVPDLLGQKGAHLFGQRILLHLNIPRYLVLRLKQGEPAMRCVLYE